MSFDRFTFACLATLTTTLFACAAGEELPGPDAGGQAAAGGAAGVGGDGGMDSLTGGGDCGLENCGDREDNDCDGEIDEDCACNPGDSEPCYDGPEGLADVGICASGSRLCLSEGEFGTWGPCNGSLLPGSETCDAELFDENCDGTSNEGCECAIGMDPVACGTDVGACIGGLQECIGGQLGTCIGQAGPFVEVCNDIDDDCDGETDEGLTMTCGVALGACQPGTATCSAGEWGACLGGTSPIAETCNNIDDNCDGVVDEGISQSCGTDVGACVAGTQVCSAGSFGLCMGSVSAITELCNGVDDSCDGTTDEGCTCTNGQTMACGTDTGACVAGTQTCSGGMWGACTGSVGPGIETCNNVDDDCDGPIDEGLTLACGSDVGACVAGTQTCTAGSYGACVGQVGPVIETCNNLDDDCDSLLDESLTQQCGTTDVGACSYGTQTCAAGSYGLCMGAINAVTEVCGNGLDDDCDTFTDEVSQCPLSPPSCACPPSTFTADPLDTITLTASCSDPDGGAVTYQWTVTSAPVGSTSQPASPNAASTTFFVDLAGSYTITLTVTDNEGQTTSCTSAITATPPQDIHVELVWDTAYGDVDLHLIRAGAVPATSWYTANDCFYGNDPAAWPPNGPSGNATLDIDDTDGYGPENINIVTNPQTGTYEIGVAYYCMHSVQSSPNQQIDPGSGPTTATVNVYCGGALVATYTDIDLDKTGRFVDVATVTWPGCSSAAVNNETWTALVQPAGYPNPLHCLLPCTQDSQCGGGEMCVNGNCALD